jgi:alkylation response protein AidB-like acyl-CoA dehydrogenase
MSIVWNQDQEEFREVVRRFCENESTEADVRRLMDSETGFDPKTWRRMSAELGLAGLAIPESFGGLGFSQLELALVMEEFGRSLFCAPYLSTVCLAVPLLLAAGDGDANGRFLPAIASGELTVAVVLPGDVTAGSEVTARQSGEQWLLDGVVPLVIDGATAELILVAAQAGGNLGLFAVTDGTAGLTRTPQATVDQTRRFARIGFSAVQAQALSCAAGAESAVQRALDCAASSLAAEQVGGAQRALDMSVDYAKMRYQFNRPIGSFQAIKHKCAEMLLDVEAARSAAYHAARQIAQDAPDASICASVAKASASDAYIRVVTDMIQIHGGIGFTWERPAHLYYKRALSSEHLFGNATMHRERLITLLDAAQASQGD